MDKNLIITPFIKGKPSILFIFPIKRGLKWLKNLWRGGSSFR
ncbi:hypothetical protein bcere0014_55610 [Bacillus cereus BDRD-ST196]|nr:hypothetical protein bcere0014_55610 [Bacillus cereus BDRD-ST196]